MKSQSKSSLFYLIILILTMIVLIIGISFTYYSLVSSDKEDSTIIKTGTLEINYIDGKAISTGNLIPINEPDLNTENFVYKKNFSVNSTGTLEQNINIYLEIKQNDFKDNMLGFALYDGSNKLSSGTIPKSGKVLLKDNLYLKNKSTNNYTVLIWLIENNENQDNQMGNMLKGGFYIEANQIKY